MHIVLHTRVESRKRLWTDLYVRLIEPGNCLSDCVKEIGNTLAGWKALFLINDIIADETVDKRRNSFLGLAISGRHN